MTLEEQLQDAYERAAELAPVSPGAYDRFLRRRARRGRVLTAAAGLALVAVLGAAVLVTRQLPQDRAPATPATTAAEPTPRPHQWVYSKELRVQYGSRKPSTIELWDRVDGRKLARPLSDRCAARAREVRREQIDFPSAERARFWRCPPGGNRWSASGPRSALGTSSPTPLRCPPTPTGCSPPSTGWSSTACCKPCCRATCAPRCTRPWQGSPGSRSAGAPPTPPVAAAWPSRGQRPSKGPDRVTGSGSRSSWTATPTATSVPDTS